MLDSFDKIEEKIISSFKNKNLHHAILLSGRKGLGKADFAKKISENILSSSNISNHPDFKHISKISGKKNISVDQVRQISSFFQNSSSQESSKIVFLEDIENLNVSSSNAILKILEEPNKNCFLIMTCGSFSQIIPTIKSRCQIYKIKNLSFDEFKERFNSQRPGFLPKLSDNELTKLSILTENSPKLAVKNGDEFLNIFHLINSCITKQYITQHEISEILKSDFEIFATIYQIFISLLIKSYEDTKISETFEEINFTTNKTSIKKLIKIYDQSRIVFAKTKNVYLDQKLVIINSINRLI